MANTDELISEATQATDDDGAAVGAKKIDALVAV